MTSSFFLCKVCGKEIPEHDVKFSSDGKTVLTPDGVPEDIFCSNCEIAHIKIATGKKSKKKQSSKKGRLDYGKMEVAELKEILKSKKLPVSGPKWQLIERLTDKNWKKKERERKKLSPPYYTQNSSWLDRFATKSKLLQLLFLLIAGYVLVFLFLVWIDFDGNGDIAYTAFTLCTILSIALGIIIFAFWSMDSDNKTKSTGTSLGDIIIVSFLLFVGGSFFLETVEMEGVTVGFQTLGICASLLTIVIVFIALNNNESMIEAAAHAWLMLTVLGAIFAIILYLVIF